MDFNIPLNNSKLTFAKWWILYGIIEYYDGIMELHHFEVLSEASGSVKTA